MKKKILVLAVAIVATIGYTCSTIQNDHANLLTLENAEAMASGEIIVGPFCMGNQGICVVYSNGLFIYGNRQYF